MKRLLVILSVLACMMAPHVALAEEVDILGGFTNGLSDFASDEVKSVEVTPEEDFLGEYEPVLREVDTVESEETPMLVSIQQFISAVNNVPNFGSTLLNAIRNLFWNTNATGPLILGSASLLVFLWWGVRKAIRMIMTAWRSGRQTV